jgi:hypothetical protein
VTTEGISYHIGLASNVIPTEVEPGKELSPTCLTSAKGRKRVQVGDGFVVCDDPELRSTFKVAAPDSEGVHHSQELLFPSGIVDFRRCKTSAFEGHWTTILIEHGPEPMKGGISVHFKWLREIRES